MTTTFAADQHRYCPVAIRIGCQLKPLATAYLLRPAAAQLLPGRKPGMACPSAADRRAM